MVAAYLLARYNTGRRDPLPTRRGGGPGRPVRTGPDRRDLTAVPPLDHHPSMRLQVVHLIPPRPEVVLAAVSAVAT